MNDPKDPLARATQALQHTDEPDWDADQRARTLHRLQSAVIPAELVLTHTPEGRTTRDTHGSTTTVSTRVLRRALREGLHPDDRTILNNLTFTVRNKHLQSVDLYLLGAYGHDLRDAAQARRDQAGLILSRLLGYDDFPINITITDISTNDQWASGA